MDLVYGRRAIRKNPLGLRLIVIMLEQLLDKGVGDRGRQSTTDFIAQAKNKKYEIVHEPSIARVATS